MSEENGLRQQVSLLIDVCYKLETWFRVFPDFANLDSDGAFLTAYEHDKEYIDEHLDRVAKLRLGGIDVT